MKSCRALVICPDMRQAEDFLHYCAEFVINSPLLAPLIRRQTERQPRVGRPCAPGAAWRDHHGARRIVSPYPRHELHLRGAGRVCVFQPSTTARRCRTSRSVTAVKPTLLTTKGMLLVASSPFGQRGELWRMHREFFGRDDPAILIAHGTTLELHPSADRAAIEAEIRSDPVRI